MTARRTPRQGEHGGIVEAAALGLVVVVAFVLFLRWVWREDAALVSLGTQLDAFCRVRDELALQLRRWLGERY